MSSKTDGNATAFPESHNACPSPGSGMTKREYFAALAMQGYASTEYVDIPLTARWAVQQADALIAELNKEPAK